MTGIMLSIIIPHFNIPSLLKRLLNSIPVKNDIQIIVVDDNSTEKLNEYNELKENYQHVLFVNNDSLGKGGGAARNVGLRIATGKWILFADADDMFIEGLYGSVSEWFDSDTDMVCFPPKAIYENTKKEYEPTALYRQYIESYENEKSIKNENILRYMWHMPVSRLIRKSIIDIYNVKFSEIPRSNDIMFAIQVSYYAKDISISNKSIYLQIVRGTQVSGIKTRINESNDITNFSIEERIKKYVFIKEKLPKDEFLDIPLHGILIVLNALLDKTPPTFQFSIKNIPYTIATYKKCRKQNIKMFHRGFFNIRYLGNIFYKWNSKRKNMRKIKYY